MNNNNRRWIWIVVAIIVVVVIVIYIASLGRLDVSSQGNFEEFKESQERAKNRHKKLLALIEKKEKLTKKLQRRFKITYSISRFILICLVGVYNALLYWKFKVNDIGDILNWNEAALFVLAAASFIAFGSIHNFRSFRDNLKLRLENWVYGKYVNIKEQIDHHSKEADQIQQQIDN